MHYFARADAHPPHRLLQLPPARYAPRRYARYVHTLKGNDSDTGLSGATDPELANLSRAQLLELNQRFLEETGLESRERALVSTAQPMSALRDEYLGAPAFVARIDWLARSGFARVRRSRGDGDCFYRSIAFAYVEKVLNAPDVALAVASALSTLESTLPLLKAAGFEPMVYEDFYEVFTSLIQQNVTPDAATGERLTQDILLEAFQEPQASNSIVVFLRLLTSAQIRADEDNYSAFLFHPETGDPMGVREFCEAFVEAIGREADHVQVTALSRALNVNVRIAYLDGRGSGDAVEFVDFRNAEDSGAEDIVLLYRPGHYDILEA